jgi:hypothetical protein
MFLLAPYCGACDRPCTLTPVARDNLCRTVDVGDHAARFRSGEAAEVGAQTQLDLVQVDRVDDKVGGTFVAPVSPSQDRLASGRP